MPSSIYTRQGDRGETSLADGKRVRKDEDRVEAYGTVDEANSWIGAALAFTEDPLLHAALTFVQHRFFNCSSNLATPPGAPFTPPSITAEDIQWLEQAVDRFEEATGPVRLFVLPGGGRVAGMLHVARTVCRRAERVMVTLDHLEAVEPLVLKFVNRASDFLFAAARYANHAEGQADVRWDKDLPAPAL